MKTGVKRAIKAAGGQKELAKKLGVTQQAVSVWLIQGHMPLRHAKKTSKNYDIPIEEIVNKPLREALLLFRRDGAN